MVARMTLVVVLALCLTACRGSAPATALPPTTRTAASAATSATPAPATPAFVPGPDCTVSPDTAHATNGHRLEGKRGGGMFIYPAVGRVVTANRPEKFLVFLDPLPASPPSPLLVHGRNRTTDTAAVFENARHLSEYGTEWGTNYLFPEAGCWELAVDEQGTRGMVVIAVAP